MKRLMKGIIFAAVATGAAYLMVRAHRVQAQVQSPSRRPDETLDDEDLTSDEKEALLRELGTYLQ